MQIQGLADKQQKPIKTIHLAEVLAPAMNTIHTNRIPENAISTRLIAPIAQRNASFRASCHRVHSHERARHPFQRRRPAGCADLRHRGIIQTAMGKYEVVRDQRKLWFQDWQGARNLAARTKFEAVNHLDKHLDQFAAHARSARHEGALGQQRANRRATSSSASCARRTPRSS